MAFPGCVREAVFAGPRPRARDAGVHWMVYAPNVRACHNTPVGIFG